VNQGGASGSTGIQMGGKQMRMAAAEARRRDQLRRLQRRAAVEVRAHDASAAAASERR
jgi:hypothetical protein